MLVDVFVSSLLGSMVRDQAQLSTPFRRKFRLKRRYFYLGNEAVAETGDGGNVLALLPAVSERLPQRGDVLVKVVFFHHRVRPDLPHKVIFFDGLSALSDKLDEGIKSLRSQRHRLAIPKEASFHRIKPKRTEFVEVPFLSRHCRFQKLFQKNSFGF